MLLTSPWISTQLITKCICLRDTPRCLSQTPPWIITTTLSVSLIVPKCWGSSASRGASTTGKWNCSRKTSVPLASAMAAWTGRGQTAAWVGTAVLGVLSGLIPKFQPGIMMLKRIYPMWRLPRLVCCCTVREGLWFSWLLGRSLTWYINSKPSLLRHCTLLSGYFQAVLFSPSAKWNSKVWYLNVVCLGIYMQIIIPCSNLS